MLDAPEGLATEYYLSNVINKMIGAGTTFAALAAERHALCGTPAALESFMEEVAAGRALNKVKRRFCFALDSVLVTEPAVEGDYSTVLPIAKNVQLVRELKESGTTGRVSDRGQGASSYTRAAPQLTSRSSLCRCTRRLTAWARSAP